MLKFGEKIKDVRVSKKISIRTMAKRLGISAGYLSKIERGEEKPPMGDLISEIAKYLEIPEHELFNLAKDAGRVPKELSDVYQKNKTFMRKLPEFLRTASDANLNEEQWNALIKRIKEDRSK